MTFRKRQRCRKRKLIVDTPGVEWGQGLTGRGCWGILGVVETTHVLLMVVVYQHSRQCLRRSLSSLGPRKAGGSQISVCPAPHARGHSSLALWCPFKGRNRTGLQPQA